MSGTLQIAQLHLDGKDVGNVSIYGWHGAWGFGLFTPNAGFAEFAPKYAQWSNLMHRSDESSRLTRELSNQLRQVEFELYRIEASLHLPGLDEWRSIALLNIDGSAIEWKESGRMVGPVAQQVVSKVAS